ncbi:MAG: hypothetical protein HWE20_08465 [Gammaproteobacteria bacterium]|nr:hypothetical protein [Gammaproteobacteria bacterium]
MQQTLHPLELAPLTPLWPWLIAALTLLLVLMYRHAVRKPAARLRRQIDHTDTSLASLDALRVALRRFDADAKRRLTAEIDALDHLRFAPTPPTETALRPILQRIALALEAGE